MNTIRTTIDTTAERTTTINHDDTVGSTVTTTSRRRRRARIILVAVALALLGTGTLSNPTNAGASGYTFHDQDRFSFWDSTGKSVYVYGAVNWFYSGVALPGVNVERGEYAKGSYVILNRTGCLWVKVSWNKATGTVSWPPSGGSNTVTDGYYRACGNRGTFVWINGISHASRALWSSTVCIGFSDYSTYTLRRYDACKTMRSV